MNDPRRQLVAVAICATILSCAARIAVAQEETRDAPTVVKIWDRAPHNAFTDLIVHDGTWYCTFREADGHVPRRSGEEGKVRVISSKDGRQWASRALIEESGVDLRDPKLSVAPDGRLMLLMGGSHYQQGRLLRRRARVAFMDAQQQFPSEPVQVEIDESIATDVDWLWRVTWWKDIGYGVVYQPGGSRWGLHLVKTTDGLNYDLVTTLDVAGRPNEATIRFLPDGEMLVVVRNEDGKYRGHLGRSGPPYTDWNWTDVNHKLGGPNVIRLSDGSLVLGSRKYGKEHRTVIGTLALDGKFHEKFVLPSGGDTSYPGMLIHDDELWVSYYSSHEGRAAIYLAKIPIHQLTTAAAAAIEQPRFTTVYSPSEDGYPHIRIPSLVVTKKGTLLAFAEGRQGGDHSENDVILKRSIDAGTTWGPVIVVHEAGRDVLVNPCAVVLDTGRVLLMYQHFPAGYHARAIGQRVKLLKPGHAGDTVSRTLTTWSDDDGKTWSPPRDVTIGTKRPETINSTATGPGVGIVLRRGKYKGRIVMPTNEGWWEGKARKFNVYACFSDDGGQMWQYGQPAPNGDQGYGNEVQMVELADGSLMLNTRSNGGKRLRKTAVSRDGGETWTPLTDDHQLPEPQCMGSILRYSWPNEGKSRLLFVNPDSQRSRKRGTVRLSYDEGKTWPVAKVIYSGGYAYSCLARLPDGRVGVLFEKDDYKQLEFAAFSLAWLEDQPARSTDGIQQRESR